MTPKQKEKIKNQIKNKEVLVFHGRKVLPLEIEDDGLIKVKALRRLRNSFVYLSVEPSSLEELIENPYSHKDPAAFLKRQGFKQSVADLGNVAMEKVFDGIRAIITYRDPATKNNKDISLMVQVPSGGFMFSLDDDETTDFDEVLAKIPGLVKMAKESKK